MANLNLVQQLCPTGKERLQLDFISMEQKSDVRVADRRACKSGDNDARTGISAHCIHRDSQILAHRRLATEGCAFTGRQLSCEFGSGLGLHSLSAVIIAASGANMMGPLLFPAIWTLDGADRRESVVRPAHIPSRR